MMPDTEQTGKRSTLNTKKYSTKQFPKYQGDILYKSLLNTDYLYKDSIK